MRPGRTVATSSRWTDDSFEAQADLFAPGTTDPAAARDRWANALARSRWRASE